jgi:hypothetical protein
VIVAWRHVWRFNTGMPDIGTDFSAPATLRKWPSLNKQRVDPAMPDGRLPVIDEAGAVGGVDIPNGELRAALRPANDPVRRDY